MKGVVRSINSEAAANCKRYPLGFHLFGVPVLCGRKDILIDFLIMKHRMGGFMHHRL